MAPFTNASGVFPEAILLASWTISYPPDGGLTPSNRGTRSADRERHEHGSAQLFAQRQAADRRPAPGPAPFRTNVNFADDRVDREAT
jgi:hypothetical protein